MTLTIVELLISTFRKSPEISKKTYIISLTHCRQKGSSFLLDTCVYSLLIMKYRFGLISSRRMLITSFDKICNSLFWTFWLINLSTMQQHDGNGFFDVSQMRGSISNYLRHCSRIYPALIIQCLNYPINFDVCRNNMLRNH